MLQARGTWSGGYGVLVRGAARKTPPPSLTSSIGVKLRRWRDHWWSIGNRHFFWPERGGVGSPRTSSSSWFLSWSWSWSRRSVTKHNICPSLPPLPSGITPAARCPGHTATAAAAVLGPGARPEKLCLGSCQKCETKVVVSVKDTAVCLPFCWVQSSYWTRSRPWRRPRLNKRVSGTVRLEFYSEQSQRDGKNRSACVELELRNPALGFHPGVLISMRRSPRRLATSLSEP